MSKFQNDSIFWIEVEKIKPNPYQPRKEFSDEKLGYLAESIRQYGVLQPLVVTRKEIQKSDGGLVAEYELIAGERRLRASKLAGLAQVPAIIREGDESEGAKLELAIIENLQREDLNPIDRAVAFQRLAEEFNFKHTEIARKIGKSREYVSNSLRLLSLPEEIRNAISSSQITEGHARPLMMLKDRPEEQMTLFKEILYKKLTVRDAEIIARKVAHDKIRRKIIPLDPEILELEGQLAESLGTRVQIERKEVGGKLTIDFFSNEDLKKILELVHSNEKKNPHEMLDNYIESNKIMGSQPTDEKNNNLTPKVSMQEKLSDIIREEDNLKTNNNEFNSGNDDFNNTEKFQENDTLLSVDNNERKDRESEKNFDENIKEQSVIEQDLEEKIEKDETGDNFIDINQKNSSENNKDNIYMMGEDFNPSISSESENLKSEIGGEQKDSQFKQVKETNNLLKENNLQSFPLNQEKQSEELDDSPVIFETNENSSKNEDKEIVDREDDKKLLEDEDNFLEKQTVEVSDYSLSKDEDKISVEQKSSIEEIKKETNIDENDDLYSVKDFTV